MIHDIEIIFDRPLANKEVVEALKDLKPTLNVRCLATMQRGDKSDILFEVSDTHDTEQWITRLSLYVSVDLGMGEYPDFRLAEYFCWEWGCHAICGVGDVISGLDPSDPFWAMCFQESEWYFADLIGTRLMGTCMDSNGNVITQQSPVRLIKQLDLSQPQAGLYDATMVGAETSLAVA